MAKLCLIVSLAVVLVLLQTAMVDSFIRSPWKVNLNKKEHGIDNVTATKDEKTGRLKYIPDLENMSTADIVKYRDLVIYSDYSHLYCKPKGLPSNVMWAHDWKHRWCQKEIGNTRTYKDLCCQGSTCECGTHHFHCYCK